MIREGEPDWRIRRRRLPHGLVPAPQVVEPSALMAELRERKAAASAKRRADGDAVGRFLSEPVDPPAAISDDDFNTMLLSLVARHGSTAVGELLARYGVPLPPRPTKETHLERPKEDKYGSRPSRERPRRAGGAGRARQRDRRR